MPKPTKRAPVKSSSKTAKKPAAPTPADEAAYLEMLVKTGQAVPAGGKLPPGATHVVVADDTGAPKAVRRRFSIS